MQHFSFSLLLYTVYVYFASIFCHIAVMQHWNIYNVTVFGLCNSIHWRVYDTKTILSYFIAILPLTNLILSLAYLILFLSDPFLKSYPILSYFSVILSLTYHIPILSIPVMSYPIHILSYPILTYPYVIPISSYHTSIPSCPIPLSLSHPSPLFLSLLAYPFRIHVYRMTRNWK